MLTRCPRMWLTSKVVLETTKHCQQQNRYSVFYVWWEFSLLSFTFPFFLWKIWFWGNRQHWSHVAVKNVYQSQNHQVGRQVRGKTHGKIMLLCLGWGRKVHLLVVIHIWGFVCLRGLIHLFIRDNCRKKLSKIVFFMKEMKQSVCSSASFPCFWHIFVQVPSTCRWISKCPKW